MKRQLAEEIRACLPDERTLFHYFKDRYALLLLSLLVGRGRRIGDIRSTRFAALLHKPLMKQIMAGCSDGWLRPEQLQAVWPNAAEPFVLTLATWEGGQTSRPGCNLVLQLNFSNKHDSRYRHLVRPQGDAVLNYRGHPVMREGARSFFRETLAWARIDLSLETGEALIEEIQSDWVRRAARLKHCVDGPCPRLESGRCFGVKGDARDIRTYVDVTLSPYRHMWDEAMLAAAVLFIREELGIRRIYYHTHETGCAVKGIRWNKPPLSLYSTLPRRFCFGHTGQAPEFLLGEKSFRRRLKAVAGPRWYLLDV